MNKKSNIYKLKTGHSPNITNLSVANEGWFDDYVKNPLGGMLGVVKDKVLSWGATAASYMLYGSAGGENMVKITDEEAIQEFGFAGLTSEIHDKLSSDFDPHNTERLYYLFHDIGFGSKLILPEKYDTAPNEFNNLYNKRFPNKTSFFLNLEDNGADFYKAIGIDKDNTNIKQHREIPEVENISKIIVEYPLTNKKIDPNGNPDRKAVIIDHLWFNNKYKDSRLISMADTDTPYVMWVIVHSKVYLLDHSMFKVAEFLTRLIPKHDDKDLQDKFYSIFKRYLRIECNPQAGSETSKLTSIWNYLTTMDKKTASMWAGGAVATALIGAGIYYGIKKYLSNIDRRISNLLVSLDKVEEDTIINLMFNKQGRL